MIQQYAHRLVFSILLLWTIPICLATETPGEELKVVVERNVPVPMRDGTILRADVHRPDRGGPYPVLVWRTPYGKENNFEEFVKAGYIVVSQDVRGRYESEGKYDVTNVKNTEPEDGYDTVEWAAKLPDSNGKVGAFGRSALAGLQWQLAPLCPPSLKVMLAESVASGAANLYPIGIERHYTWVYSHKMNLLPDLRRRENRPGIHTRWEAFMLWQQESRKWINWLPLRDMPWGGYNYQEGQKFNSRWEDRDALIFRLDEGCKDITVPNLNITGWYDFCNDNMLLFRTMVEKAKTEVARTGSRIIIGPWTHSGSGGPEARHVGDFDFGPDVRLDLDAMRIHWFDYWLKGIENDADKDAPVKIFVMGDNKWRDEQRWPIQRAKDKVLFVTSNGHGNRPTGDGKLVWQQPEQLGKDRYLYDPNDPVPTLLNPPSLLLSPNDQRPLSDREDILVYQTEPLEERFEVTGNPVIELYASSSAPDTDWFVRLIDVALDGSARNISWRAVRARYRNGFDEPEFLKLGEVVKYTLRMWPTSNAFLPGHRIRIDITSSDFPVWDRNHNTAVDQYDDATLVIAKQTVYHGGEHATRIILPWIPNPVEQEGAIEKKQVQAKPQKQEYPLHQAAVNGDVEQIRILISKGADINAKDEEGKTPLCLAVKSGKMEIVRVLAESGADVNLGSWPPLSEAVDKNDVTIAKYLIGHGANVNAPERWTALQEAPYISNNVEMVELLIANGGDLNAGSWTPLEAMFGEGRIDIISRLLVLNNADVQAMMPKGLTPLHYMSTYDMPDIVETLLAKGAKVDERDDNYEFTALHYAARFGTTKVAEVLIAHGADIKAKDKWAYEPIHWAAYHDRPEIIELLIAKGADVNVKTSLGQRPLELAIPRRNTGAIEVLRKHGAKE